MNALTVLLDVESRLVLRPDRDITTYIIPLVIWETHMISLLIWFHLGRFRDRKCGAEGTSLGEGLYVRFAVTVLRIVLIGSKLMVCATTLLREAP
jgi:hypothetical protein